MIKIVSSTAIILKTFSTFSLLLAMTLAEEEKQYERGAVNETQLTE